MSVPSFRFNRIIRPLRDAVGSTRLGEVAILFPGSAIRPAKEMTGRSAGDMTGMDYWMVGSGVSFRRPLAFFAIALSLRAASSISTGRPVPRLIEPT